MWEKASIENSKKELLEAPLENETISWLINPHEDQHSLNAAKKKKKKQDDEDDFDEENDDFYDEEEEDNPFDVEPSEDDLIEDDFPDEDDDLFEDDEDPYR